MSSTTRTSTPAVFAAVLLLATCALAGGEYKTHQVKGEHHKVGVKYKPAVRAGYATSARLWVTATDGWHMNEKFPYKVTLTLPDGVEAQKTTFKKADAVVFNDSKIVFKVPYKVTGAGQHKLSAKVNLAVCQKEQCVPHTSTVSWTVDGVEGIGGQ